MTRVLEAFAGASWFVDPPYQRGQRDGLLAVADELDAIEMRQKAEAESWERRDHPGSRRQVEIWTAWASGTRDAASLCRRRAESLPDDPEEQL